MHASSKVWPRRTVYADLFSLLSLEDPARDVLALKMPAHVFTAHDTLRVDPLQNPFECGRFRIQSLDILRCEIVLLGPVRTAFMTL